MTPPRPLLERIIARIDVADCWVWTGALTKAGYGAIGRGRRDEGIAYTHRAMYELLVGPIKPGLDLDHLCRNRACCNPDHLEPVSRAENVRRGAQVKRAGTALACKHGHAFTPENTTTWRGKRKCKACANARYRQRTQGVAA